jgi:hypothetical protein
MTRNVWLVPWLPLVFILATSGGAKLFLLFGTNVGNNILVADEYSNLDYANSILADVSYRSHEGQAYRPPVYSILLAAFKFLAGNRIIFYKLMNISLSLITIALVYFCIPPGWRFLGALAVATHPTYFFLYELVLAENLAILWVALIVFQLSNKSSIPKMSRLILLGVFSGFLGLTRPESLGFLMPLHIWLVWTGGRKYWYSFGLLLLIVNCWLIRNYLIFDRYPLLSTNGANTFYLATFPESTGTGIYSTDDLSPFPTFARDLEVMRGMNEIDRYVYYMRKGREYLLEAPDRFIRLWPTRVRILLGPEFAVPGRLIRAGRFHLTRGQFSWYLILVTLWEFMAVVAIAIQVLRRRFEFKYLIFLLGLVGVVSLVIAEARFKIQVLPALVVGLALSLAGKKENSIPPQPAGEP